MHVRIFVLTTALFGAGAARADDGLAPKGAAATAAAPSGLDAEAQRHATLGQRFLERGEGQRAIGEFRRAYELRAEPRFLFDIAESYEHIGLDDQARFFYDRYLRAAPDAPDREEIEERIAAIDERAPAAVPRPLAPPPAPAPASFAHDVVVLPVADAPPAQPVWKRWWAWAAVGAILATAAVAVYSYERGSRSAPATALGDKTFY